MHATRLRRRVIETITPYQSYSNPILRLDVLIVVFSLALALISSRIELNTTLNCAS
jgi:hypothetical protein